MAKPAASRKRFVYLAARKGASEPRTYEIALDYQFLWRPCHKKSGQMIGKVDLVGVGDLIVLGYRSDGRFHVSLPLVVKEAGPCTRPIDPADKCRSHDHAPFAIAHGELDRVLNREGYKPDPVVDAQVGLNVDPLEVDIKDRLATAALGKDFPSPGMDAIWPADELGKKEGYREICDWVSSL